MDLGAMNQAAAPPVAPVAPVAAVPYTFNINVEVEITGAPSGASPGDLFPMKFTNQSSPDAPPELIGIAWYRCFRRTTEEECSFLVLVLESTQMMD